MQNFIETLPRYKDYYFRESKESDIDIIAPFVKAEEVLELWYLYACQADDLLKIAFERKEKCILWTMQGPDKVLGIGGLMPLDPWGTAAQLWFLGLDLKEHDRFLARISKPLVQACLQKFPVIMNVVGAWNTSSISWLKHAGFCVEEAYPMGFANKMFHPFHISRNGLRLQ